MIFSNCGFFGFPLLKAVYGDIGVFWGGFYVTVFNIVMWTYGVFILSRANREMKIKITKIFINNGSVPCILGVILYILRFRFYQPVYHSMDLIGSTCTPLSMIIIGGMIAEIPVKRLISEPHVYYTSFIHLVVLPVVSGLVLKLFGFPREIAIFGRAHDVAPQCRGIGDVCRKLRHPSRPCRADGGNIDASVGRNSAAYHAACQRPCVT